MTNTWPWWKKSKATVFPIGSISAVSGSGLWSSPKRNWKIDNLGVSDVARSETGLQFSYLFGSKLHQALPSHPNDFRHISIHCEKYSSVHFCTRRHVLHFLWSSNILNIGCVFCGSELTDSWKRTKLNGKVSDLPDRISSVLNVPLSNINVDGYICNEHSYRSRPKASWKDR